MQTTKTLVMTEISAEHSEKDQFKASVGVAVQTVGLSLSVIHFLIAAPSRGSARV